MKYTPRRAGKRWLEDAPEYILDCFKNRECDGGGYDILFCGSLLGTMEGRPHDFANTYIMGLEISDYGDWCSFEIDAYQATQYRRRNGKRRQSWNSLPEDVRNTVTRWAVME